MPDEQATEDQARPPLPEGGADGPATGGPSRRRRLLIRALRGVVALVAAWLLLAYLMLPMLWRHYEHHPVMEGAPKVTRTAQGIAGDPLNVGFLGSKEQLLRAMLDSGWDAADPLTLKSSLGIARSVLRNRPDPEAPVSNLFLFGRKQDLAFEEPVGNSARHRHHVRFWESAEYGRAGVPLWIGAVTYDRSVGLSRRTGQITHHIGADVDAERDGLVAALRAHGWLMEAFQVTGVGPTLSGRNGGGDPYFTDGEVTIGVLAPEQVPEAIAEQLDNPLAVRAKDGLWSAVRPVMRAISGP